MTQEKSKIIKTIIFGILIEISAQFLITYLDHYQHDSTIGLSIICGILLIFGAMLVYYVWIKKQPFEYIQPVKKLDNDFLLLLLSLLIAVVEIIRKLDPAQHTAIKTIDTIDSNMFHHHAWLPLLCLILIECVFGPIAEEIIFRYALMNPYENQQKRISLAVFSALLFMYLHVNTLNPLILINYLPLTTILTLRYYYTKDLRGNIRWHSAYNFSANVINYVLVPLIASLH